MPVYTVTQVTRYLRGVLEGDPLLTDLWVSGEVGDVSRSAVGHLYFSLTDGQAVLRCVLFRGEQGAEWVATGRAVAVHGRVSFYDRWGALQLYVDRVRPEGLGALRQELERLKARLEREGLFDPSRKRPLPPFPRRIAVVTSPVGAVWHDIQTVVRRRWPLAELVLVPCQVQGERASETLVAALEAVNGEEGLDLVILARGGGSLEDLWPFNEEAVARAVFACRYPVVSAVGHETDTTLADLVADRRAPTPSAAAAMAVPDREEVRRRVAHLAGALGRAAESALRARRQGVERLTLRLAHLRPDTAGLRQQVDDVLRRGQERLLHRLALLRARLQGLEARLSALDPRAVLERGYALVQRTDTGEAVTHPAQAPAGTPLTLTLRSGTLRARSEGVHAGSP